MMKRLMMAVMGAALAGCCSWCAKKPIAAVSPDGKNEIRLYTAPLAYEVLRDGVVVVAKSEIGMRIDGVCCGKDALSPKAVTKSSRSGMVSTPVYKKSSVDLTAEETFADFGDWGIRLAARNDGVAYRFETTKPGTVTVNCEKADLAIPDQDATCWIYRTGGFGQEEAQPESVKAKDISTPKGDSRTWMGKDMVYLPLAYTVGGKFVAVTESDVRDYPIWNFVRGEGDALKARFSAWPKKCARKESWNPTCPAVEKGGRKIVILEFEDYLVKTSGTRTFPWRTFVLADRPVAFCEADIVYALAAPAAAEADFSWVKPGKVAWDWWNCFDNSPKDAPNGGCTTKTYERFIDFAAKTGVEYVIFDEGWSEHLNIWKFHPEVDVAHLIDYANQKGVGIILWMAWAQVYGDEEHVASHFAKLGAKGFKVDFMDRGDAECAQFLEKFAAACAKEKMLVDYHGAYRPTGLHRKYPNVLNYEGIHGLEQSKWFEGGEKADRNMMFNDVAAFYLRLTAGPMDYTPGAMLNHAVGTGYRGEAAGEKPGSVGTRCRQMAMMALYEAPLQMLCDAPTNYEKNMECFTFMAATPVVWVKTVGLDGCPESMVAAARQAKDGSWYAAAMTTADPRDYSLDTSFLGAGDWKAEIFCDGADADKVGTSYVHETKTVKAGDKMAFHMAPGGGFVVRFAK